MRAHLNRSTDGEPIHFYMSYWPALYGQFISDHRPSLKLQGRWQNPNLVMNDERSISHAFRSDGSVKRSDDRSAPSNEIVPITLVRGSYSDYEAACATVIR
jgi:hypothetical protein